MLKGSCALTLALKFKLRTMRATFTKFGPQLETSDGVGLKIPSDFKQKLNFISRESDKKGGKLEGT